jgi:Protein of unknown function (DUF3618)
MAQESDQVTRDTVRNGETTAEIRSQIEQTRAEMSETIEAIQERLSPGRLIADAQQRAGDATIGRVKRVARRARREIGSARETFATEGLLPAVRSAPITLAVVGAAVAALTVRGLMRRRSDAAYVATRGTEGRWRSAANGIDRGRQALILAGLCAGAVCWSAWSVQDPATAFPPPNDSEDIGAETINPYLEPY